jgi:hypothetical protein
MSTNGDKSSAGRASHGASIARSVQPTKISSRQICKGPIISLHVLYISKSVRFSVLTSTTLISIDGFHVSLPFYLVEFMR